MRLWVNAILPFSKIFLLSFSLPSFPSFLPSFLFLSSFLFIPSFFPPSLPSFLPKKHLGYIMFPKYTEKCINYQSYCLMWAILSKLHLKTFSSIFQRKMCMFTLSFVFFLPNVTLWKSIKVCSLCMSQFCIPSYL